MKKFIMNLLGIEATAKNIRGRKSNGTEDYGDHKNWRSLYGKDMSEKLM